MNMPRFLPIAVVFLISSFPAEAEWKWIEGEDAAKTQIRQNGWYNTIKGNVLSGGSWLSHYSGSERGTATYQFELPKKGNYYLWMRANPVKSSMAGRFNGGNWTRIDLKRRQREVINVAADDKPDLRFIGWARVGVVPMKEGANTVEFRFDSKIDHHGAIDCFCFTTDEKWVPRGAYKPDEEMPSYSLKEITDAQFKEWMAYIRPKEDELKWRNVRWHQALSDAQAEARKLGRPILLWTMNGHPCGET